MRTGLKKAESEPGLADKPAGMTAYSQAPNETNRDIMTRMKSIHLGLKYKFIYPAIWLLQRYNKKHYKGIPNAAHNRNLMVFDKAVEKAIEKWHTEALANAYCYPIKRGKAHWDRQQKRAAGELLRTSKETILLFALTDTAYRNFLDILMFEITLAVQEEYKDAPAGKPQHLLYNSKNISQPEYFYLHQCALSKDLSLYKTDERSCCDREAIKKAAEILAQGRAREVRMRVDELRKQGIVFTNADDIIAVLEELEENPEMAEKVINELKKQ